MALGAMPGNNSPQRSPHRRRPAGWAEGAVLHSPHQLGTLARRAARVSERAAMATVLSTVPTSPHRALQQCRANHVRLGVRRVEDTLQQETGLLEACPSDVRQMVQSCGGQEAAERLAALAAVGTERLPALEKEAVALRTRCAELETKLEEEKRRRLEASRALESHAAQMVEQVQSTHESHAEQLQRHRSEHDAEVLARQEGWEQAASEHADEVMRLREQWNQTAQRHADEVKQLYDARDAALAHAKVAEEKREAQAAALSQQEEAVRMKWSALESSVESIHTAVQAVEHAEAAQLQAEAEKTAVEVQLRAEREARQRAEACEREARLAAASTAEERANERTAAADKARQLQTSAQTLARQLAGVREVQTSLRQQVQVLQIALATFAQPTAHAVGEHFSLSAQKVAAETHAVRDEQAAQAEQQQLETMRLLIDAVRAEARATSTAAADTGHYS